MRSRDLIRSLPPASPANDALIQLVMVKGCQHLPAIQALDEEQRFRTCRMFRSRSKAFEKGLKHEAQIVRWLSRHPHAFAFLHYAVYMDYSDELAANAINGVPPTIQDMSIRTYPLSRPIQLVISSFVKTLTLQTGASPKPSGIRFPFSGGWSLWPASSPSRP